MSVYNVFKFFEFFNSNKDVKKKICSVLKSLDSLSFSDKDIIDAANKIVLIGREYEFDFTREELFEYLEQNYQNLTSRDLEYVSGGFGRKAVGASLSAIAILSLGTGAIKFFNRNDNNRIFPERNTVALKNGDDSEDEDFYDMVDENKKYKGGKSNWGDLLKKYKKDSIDTVNEEFYKTPSFNRNLPINKAQTFKRPNNLPNISLKSVDNSFSKLIDDKLKNGNTNNINLSDLVNQSSNKGNQNSAGGNNAGNSNAGNQNSAGGNNAGNSNAGNQNSAGGNSTGNGNAVNRNLGGGNSTGNSNSGNQNFGSTLFNRPFFKGNDHIVSESDSYLYVILNQIYYNEGLKRSIINSDSNIKVITLLKNLFLKHDSASDISEEVNKFKDLFKDKVDIYKFNLSEIYQDIMDELENGGINSKFRVDRVPAVDSNEQSGAINSENIDETEQNGTASSENIQKINKKVSVVDNDKNEQSGATNSENIDETEQNDTASDESILGFDIEKVKNKKSLNKCFDKNGVFSDDAGNKYKINEYPDDLTIYLNRFRYDDDINNNLKKLSDSFEIPNNINIDDHNYKLKTVIVNIGKADEGKYVLYVNDNGSWKKLHESKIENVKFGDIKEEIDKNAVMVTYDTGKKSL